jgi:archaellum biogenesis ATPase FlaH
MGFNTMGEPVTNVQIIEGLDKGDAKKVIIGLLDRYPSLKQEEAVLEFFTPETIRELINKAGAKVNTSLTDFQQPTQK